MPQSLEEVAILGGCNSISTLSKKMASGGLRQHVLQPTNLTLAQKNARTEREVAYYADLLCITPKYLSQVSRAITGLPASGLIQFYASFELVSLLNDTTKTLTEVSDLMHFENASHFSRYVKITLGKSPSDYRNK